MSNEEELIDPQSWTQKELVKHLYREILEIKKGQKEMIESIELKQKAGLSTIVIKQDAIDDRVRELEKDFHKRKGFYAAAAAVIAFLFSLIGNYVSK